MNRRPVIIDCDPGIDDAMALLAAFRAPELDIRAITPVAGNVPLRHTAPNPLKILALGGREDIPVYPNVRSLISITFSIDINGVFSVSASVVGSEMPVTIEMLDSVLLTDKMIDNIIDEDKREKEEIIKEMREDLISEIELRLQDLENSDNYRMIALVARERDWLNENMYTGSVEELQQCLDRLK